MSLRCSMGMHDWYAEGNYFGDPCRKQLRCKRCNQQTVVEAHVWGRLQYELETRCVLIQFCQRCQQKNYPPIPPQHDFYQTDQNGFPENVCRRCGFRVTLPPSNPSYPSF
jgi:DNA-directed RNA polymerase subunit RPC12/RpoP